MSIPKLAERVVKPTNFCRKYRTLAPNYIKPIDMTIAGTLLLALAGLGFLFFSSSIFGSYQPRGGDYVAGYAWGVILFFLAFLGILLIASLLIAYRGGFDWLSEHTAAKYLLLLFGLISSVSAAALSAMFRNEPDAAAVSIRWFSGFAPILIPVLLLLAGVVLNNESLRNSLPPLTYKIPLHLGFWLGLLINGLFVRALVVQSSANAQARVEETLAFQDKNHQRMLQEIDSCDVSKNMVFILVMTDANQDKEVRERAVAKVKTHPQWQQELIRILGTGYASEAFNFLASNEVDDKSLFPEAIRTGIAQQAAQFRESIRRSSHSSHFYPERFLWETERVLRTVERFRDQGTDFTPAVKELRAALDEPSDVEKSSMKAEKVLDEWLKKAK
ncbi:MAG: hypothetical protein IT261_03970 [Saprospiraceae bacterium]|nr:hypothetical protein [Saprospiraceae bacterium]